MRPVVLVLVMACVQAIAGCGGSPQAASSPAVKASADCTSGGHEFSVTSPDGYMRHAAVYGSGPAVVIAHQSDETRCDVVPIATWLSRHGYAAVAVDLGGYWTGLLAATVTAMRQRGSKTVQLLGASMGGCDAMVVGSHLSPPVNAVLSLGGERRLSPELDADKAVAQSRVPLLIVTSENDGFLSGSEARLLMSESASTDKKLVVLPGTLHGFAMLDGPDGPQVKQSILDFLAAHSGAA